MSTFSTKKYEVSSIFKALTVLGLFSCCKAPLGVQLASLPQRFFSTRPMPTVPMGVRTPGAPLVQSPQFLEDILFTGRLGECWRILVAVAVLMRLAAYPRPALWSLCVSSHCQLCVTSVCSNGKLEWGKKRQGGKTWVHLSNCHTFPLGWSLEECPATEITRSCTKWNYVGAFARFIAIACLWLIFELQPSHDPKPLRSAWILTSCPGPWMRQPRQAVCCALTHEPIYP